MTSIVYMSALDDQAKGMINYLVDNFSVMLVSSLYNPDPLNHTKRSHVIASEVNGTGYDSGGKSVNVSVNKDNVNKREDINLGGADWVGASISARGAVYFKARGGNPQDDELVLYVDFLSDVTCTNGTFTLGSSILRTTNRSI